MWCGAQVISIHNLHSLEFLDKSNSPQPTGWQRINNIGPIKLLFFFHLNKGITLFFQQVDIRLHDQDREVPVEYLYRVVKHLVLNQLIFLVLLNVLCVNFGLSLNQQLLVTLLDDCLPLVVDLVFLHFVYRWVILKCCWKKNPFCILQFLYYFYNHPSHLIYSYQRNITSKSFSFISLQQLKGNQSLKQLHLNQLLKYQLNFLFFNLIPSFIASIFYTARPNKIYRI